MGEGSLPVIICVYRADACDGRMGEEVWHDEKNWPTNNGRLSHQTFGRVANSTSVNALSTGCSPSLKKGARSGKDQAGQKYEAPGGGKRRRAPAVSFVAFLAVVHRVIVARLAIVV